MNQFYLVWFLSENYFKTMFINRTDILTIFTRYCDKNTVVLKWLCLILNDFIQYRKCVMIKNNSLTSAMRMLRGVCNAGCGKLGHIKSPGRLRFQQCVYRHTTLVLSACFYTSSSSDISLCWTADRWQVSQYVALFSLVRSLPFTM